MWSNPPTASQQLKPEDVKNLALDESATPDHDLQSAFVALEKKLQPTEATIVHAPHSAILRVHYSGRNPHVAIKRLFLPIIMLLMRRTSIAIFAIAFTVYIPLQIEAVWLNFLLDVWL